MRTGTPKSRRPIRTSAQPLSTTSHLKNLQRPAKPNNFDFSTNALNSISDRLTGMMKRGASKKRAVNKNSTPRHKETVKTRQHPKSASHKRRGSQVEVKKPVHTRKFSGALRPTSSVVKSAWKTRQGVIPDNPNKVNQDSCFESIQGCLLYTSDAADE